MSRTETAGGRRATRDRSRSTTRRARPERRRADPIGEVEIALVRDGEAIEFDRFDLSAVGVYLYADLLLSEGEEVSLRLRLPGSPRVVSLGGRVVRSQTGDAHQPAGMGVAFSDPPREVTRALREHVARRFLRHVGR